MLHDCSLHMPELRCGAVQGRAPWLATEAVGTGASVDKWAAPALPTFVSLDPWMCFPEPGCGCFPGYVSLDEYFLSVAFLSVDCLMTYKRVPIVGPHSGLVARCGRHFLVYASCKVACMM